MSWIEIVGTVFGLACVVLTTMANVWCWPTGIVNVVLFFIMFAQARLYAELITYGVFFVLSIYGWWQWVRGGPARSELHVTRTPARLAGGLSVLAVASAPALGYLLATHTDAALPWIDSVITVLSLIAQWMLARKLLENWLLWIAVDIMAIGVYASRQLYLTSGLYAVFLMLATLGYFKWRRLEPA